MARSRSASCQLSASARCSASIVTWGAWPRSVSCSRPTVERTCRPSIVMSGSRSRFKRTSVSNRSNRTARYRAARLIAYSGFREANLVEAGPVPDRTFAVLPAEIHDPPVSQMREIHEPEAQILRVPPSCAIS